MLKNSLTKLCFVIPFILAFSSCTTQTIHSPVQLNDNITVASPDSVGIDSTKLKKLVNKIAKHDSIFGPEINQKNDYVGVTSILLMRHDKLVFERYFNGAGKHRAHPMASLGKSVMSAIVGIAIEQQYLHGPEQKILHLLPVIEQVKTPAQSSLNLHHLLTMTVDWKCNAPAIKAFQCTKQFENQDSPVHFLLNQPFVITENQLNYDDANPYLIDVILTIHAKQNAAVLADKYLNKPLQFKNNVFKTGKLTSREMVKFGQMYLNGGKVAGEQVVPETWVKLSTAPHIRFANKTQRLGAYGYFWWITEFNYHEKKITSYYAAGNGGQFIYVVPELALVAVFTGINFNDYRNMRSPHQMMEKYILPALDAG